MSAANHVGLRGTRGKSGRASHNTDVRSKEMQGTRTSRVFGEMSSSSRGCPIRRGGVSFPAQLGEARSRQRSMTAMFWCSTPFGTTSHRISGYVGRL